MKYVHWNPLLHRQKCLVIEPLGDHVFAGHGWIVVGLLQKKFAGHAGHCVLKVRPVSSEYDPSGHWMTTPSPQKYPAGHGTHDPPSCEGIFPTMQFLHWVAPFQATPDDGHRVHALVPTVLEKVPFGQGLQTPPSAGVE
jgi:hypothetical protein